MVAGASGHRPLPARDRRGRGRAAADARAPRDPAPARNRARRRRRDEGGRRRRRDARARASRRRASSCRAPTVVAVSAKTGAGLDELKRRARGRSGGAGRARRGPRACTSTASSRCAGSARSRPARCGRGRSPRATSCGPSPPGCDVRVRSVQVHDEPVERAEAGQRVAVALPGHRARASSAAATRSSAPARFRRATGWTSRSSRDRGRCPPRVQRPPRHDARSSRGSRERATVTRSCGSRRPSSRRAATASCCARHTTVGGGRVLDPAAAAHADPERMALVDRGDVAATIHAPVRSDAGVAHLLGRRAPRTSSKQATGCTSPSVARRAPQRERELRGSTRPIRSIPASRRRRSRGRPPSPRCSASNGAARSSTGPGRAPSLDGREEEARRARGCDRGRADSESWTTPSWGRSSSTRAACTASATASPSRPSCTSARSHAIRELEPDHDRRRSATGWASPAASRSSCSSASTPTASRAASATSVC